MPTRLYLDTARLGQMSAGARAAHADYVRFACEEGCTAEFDELLRDGSENLSPELRSRFPGLSDWQGVRELKQAACGALQFDAGSDVLLAGRSCQWAKFAARLLFRLTDAVLTTDADWPAYVAALESEARRRRGRVVKAAIRERLRDRGCRWESVAAEIAAVGRRHRVGGLFLASITNEGFRIPVAAVVASLTLSDSLRLVVVDGAQEFCHSPAGKTLGACDIYLAGCHKWLAALHPMGLAFLARNHKRGVVEETMNELLGDGELDDPLLALTEELARDDVCPFRETVSIGSLFASRAAIADLQRETGDGEFGFRTRLANGEVVADAARGTGWTPLLPHESLRSGILLLQAERAATREAPPPVVRWEFQRLGIALTSYAGGLIRLSMPRRPWEAADLDCLRRSLRALA